MSFHYPINGGSGPGGGVTSLNTLTGALNLVEGVGIDITTSGSDITIAAIGANVPSDTSLAVKVATTAALPGTPTYNNGTAGVGATLTRSSNGTTGTIDGVTAANLMVGDYILVKNQAAQLQNGVYSVTQQGTASLPYILTRVTEADTTAELDDLVVTAASGTTNKGVPYGQQTNNPIIGSSNIVFTATGIYMRQVTSGTQAIDQIPTYTGTALTQTKGTANFKYNPTNDLFTIRGVDYTFPANNGAAGQALVTDGAGTLSWGIFITEGAPTQADRASVDITVLNTDYDELVGTQLTFGTVPNQTVLEYYNSSETPPSLPILGISLNYNQAQSLYNVVQHYSNGDTITIGSRTYTLQDTLTNVDGNIQRDGDDLVTAQNIVDAINLTGTPGTQYASAMTANTEVSATVSAPHFTAIALEYGPSGNSIALSTVSANGNAWNTSTLEGGSQPTTDDVAVFTQDKIIKNFILADEKLINASYSSGDTLSVYVERPGTYGNGIAVDSTNDTAVTPATTTTLGGLDNGTTGSIGALRKGVVEITYKDGNIKIDSLFTAISDNVWMITSSTNNNLVNGAYDWINV